MTGPAPDDLRTVRLLELPVQVWAASQEHHDELMREFALLTAGQEDDETDTAPLPRRLLRLVRELTTRFAGSSDAQRELLFAAAAKGERVVEEVGYTLPVAAGPACEQLLRMLEEADAYCRAGRHLLTLETPQELRLFREWYLGQVCAQLDGASPVPWPDHVARARAAGG